MGNQPSSETSSKYKMKNVEKTKEWSCTDEISNVAYDVAMKLVEKRKLALGLLFSDGSSFWYYRNGKVTKTLGSYQIGKVPPVYITKDGVPILNRTYDSPLAPYIIDQSEGEITKEGSSEKSRYSTISKKIAEIEDLLREEGLIDLVDDLIEKLKMVSLEDVHIVDVEEKKLVFTVNWRHLCSSVIEKEAREILSEKYFVSEDQFRKYQKSIVKYIRIYTYRVRTERNTYILKQLKIKQKMIKIIVTEKPQFPYLIQDRLE